MPPPAHLVTLGDATLRTDDLALLVPPAWLNDAVISFWVEHLRLHVVRPSHAARVAILPPNLSFFLALCDDDSDADALLRDLRLAERDLILVTVNDSRAVDFTSRSPSGSHWSLLVFERRAATFFYLDSLPLSPNRPTAVALAAKLRRLLSLPPAPLVDLPVPKQDNLYDCGAFVCMFAEDVVVNFQAAIGVADLYTKGRKFLSGDVECKRQEIGKLACRLLDENQRAQVHHLPHPPP